MSDKRTASSLLEQLVDDAESHEELSVLGLETLAMAASLAATLAHGGDMTSAKSAWLESCERAWDAAEAKDKREEEGMGA